MMKKQQFLKKNLRTTIFIRLLKIEKAKNLNFKMVFLDGLK